MNRTAATALATIAALTATACAQVEYTEPTLRQVSYGFEDLVEARDWASEALRLDAVGSNAVSISVGRPEWTAFALDDHPQSISDAASARGDLVQPALDALADGREVTLVVDAFAPSTLAQQPALAGEHADGSRSSSIGSVSALEGELGDQLVAYVGSVAERYRPDVVGITELLFDGATFGAEDLTSFRDATGASDWPRDASGAIVEDDVTISNWVSRVMARVVARAAAAAHEHGALLAMDVRVSRADGAAGRPESGHDYALLAEAADRLVLWNFFDSGEVDPAASSDLTAALADSDIPSEQLLVQVGLWAPDGESIDPSTLETALRRSASNGISQVSVTPASLLDDQHWEAVAAAWE